MAAIAADQRHVQAGRRWAQRALAADPRCVPAHFAPGCLLEAEDRVGEAEASYRHVTELDPANAGAFTNLGRMLHLQQRFEEAVRCHRRALQLEPGQPVALRNYALVAGGPQEIGEALQGFERHVALHPGDAEGQWQLGHLYQQVGRHAQSLAAYERAITLRAAAAGVPFRPRAGLLLGRYEEGWAEYASSSATPCWRRSSAPRLQELIAGVAQAVPEGAPLPHFDAHLPLVACPLLFGTTVDTVPWRGPYLQADATRQREWQERAVQAAPRRRKVGLVWTGNPGNLGNRRRSVNLQRLAGLAGTPDVTFFSLQKGGPEVAPGPVPEGMHFVDLTEQIRDFSDTAAFLACLDLMISVDTAVAHLAGTTGRPVWVLLPFSADWRYHTGRDDNPWYPSMRLFRQDAEGDWSGTLERLRLALAEGAAH